MMQTLCPHIDFSIIEHIPNHRLNELLENEEALMQVVKDVPFVRYLCFNSFIVINT